MTIPRAGLTLLGLLTIGACHRTVVVTGGPAARPAPAPGPVEDRSAGRGEGGGPSTAATLGIPPGHLPKAGQCRVWIPGTPPGHQPGPKSRSCDGIAGLAPAGSWIVYRPTADRKVVHVRVVDERRAGVVIRIRVFELESGRLLREENP